MPHKNDAKPRGRPRAFDERAVVAAARDAFWDKGLANVSLDAIAEKTGVARPSLAAAFGDKRDLYLRAVALFAEDLRAAVTAKMSGSRSLREELTAFYEAGVELYLSGAHGPRGCLAVCTMPSEAVESADVREGLKGMIDAADEAFFHRFKRTLPERAARARAEIAGAILHSLALRARAGTPKRDLKAMIREGVDLLCAG